MAEVAEDIKQLGDKIVGLTLKAPTATEAWTYSSTTSSPPPAGR